MSLDKIDIEIIPHECQRYPTCGDWQFEAFKENSIEHEKVQINISDTGNEDSNFLVALHELIEAYLCKKAGISEEVVDKWDKDHLDSNDPGSLLGCPYRQQHLFALYIEKEMAWALKAKWEDHEKRIEALFEEKLK